MKIGIDIGGSHVGIGLVDEFGNIQQKKEKYIVEKIENESQINKQNLKEEITQFIIQTIKEYQKMDFVENVGIAVPGTVNQTTIIKAVNLGIENYEITPIIEKETGTKVKLKNDAKCSALAEQKYGNFSECENGLFLCIGTGVGGAVIYNGKVLEAKEVPGFEFSHMIIQKNGLQCNCGKRGCFEIYASLKRFKEKIAYEFNLTTLRNEEVIKIILNNKNENSSTFNQSLLFIDREKSLKTIVIGWKEISRRYEFNDISWLYDIDFEILTKHNIDKVVCIGLNEFDIATRMNYAGIDSSKIVPFDTLEKATTYIKKKTKGDIYAILNFDYVEPFHELMTRGEK